MFSVFLSSLLLAIALTRTVAQQIARKSRCSLWLCIPHQVCPVRSSSIAAVLTLGVNTGVASNNVSARTAPAALPTAFGIAFASELARR
jgi:hypothetical protein